MQRKFWMSLALLLVIPGLLFTVSCAKKTVTSEAAVSEMPKTEAPVKSEVSTATQDAEAAARARAAELERQRQLEEERLKAQQLRDAQMEEARRQAEIAAKLAETKKNMFVTELVLFDFDSSALTMPAQTILRRKAVWLKENPDAKVTIEGHCDERGTVEYNLALGWRRAEAAKAFLVDLGVAASRLTTISFGEERPFVKGSNENAWSQNRRAHFVVN